MTVLNGKLNFKLTRTREKEKCIMKEAHFHEHHELYLLISGKVTYFIDGKIFILNEGDFIFIPKGKFHQTKYEPGGMEKFMLEFSDEFLGVKLYPYIERLGELTHFKIQAKHRHTVNNIIKELEEENARNDGFSHAMERLYLEALLISFFRFSEEPLSEALSDTYKTVQAAAQYINTNYEAELTLGFMAKKYSVSQEYFSKIFKAATGIGFLEYLNMTRLMAAKDLLETSDKSVTHIASECGFDSTSYFIQLFKRVNGITPKQYSMHFRNLNEKKSKAKI